MDSSFRVLDLYCGGGGAAMGLSLAGFHITGVDKEDNRWYYPFNFFQANVLELSSYYISQFDFVWASPPCQAYTNGAKSWGTASQHPDLIGPTRELLTKVGVPFIIENVEHAPLREDLFLCGKMFGLPLIRHRSFEIEGCKVEQPLHELHEGESYIVTGGSGGHCSCAWQPCKRHRKGGIEKWKEAMMIDWLPGRLIREAVPVPYSLYIGRQVKWNLCQRLMKK